MKLRKAFIVLLAVILVSSNFSYFGVGSVSAEDRSNVDRSSDPESDGWELTWSDEFDGNEINMDNWSFDEPTNGRWNDEIQSYTEDNAWVEDGSLIIEAREEDITEEDGQVYHYSSSKLWTQDKQTLTYGRVDVRAKLPEGQGMWPAIWMMPNNEPFYGTWPVSGEIDIMELLGHEPDTVHGAVHFGAPHRSIEGTYRLEDGTTFADDYHVFSIEWEPGEIRWYVNDVHYHTANDWFTKHPDHADAYTYPAPFDQPFMLILNISVGGGWPGNPDETTVFPQQMAVDYVRFYEKDEYPVHEKPESAEDGEGRAPLEDGNYVYNGNFDSNDPEIDGIEGVPYTDYWTFLQADGGNATLEVNDGALDVQIGSGGNVEHGVQVLQSPIHLVEGATYRASFRAKAENERPLKVKIGGDGDAGWADYARKEPFTLSNSWEDYAFEFKMEDLTDVKARYEFNMGLDDSNVSLTDVKLEKIAEPDPADTIRGPLPTGNYIYNGTFDQGEGRMGFWEFHTDATADATYYIGSAINERRFDALITDGGTHVNAVQLTQSNFRLENGRTYELTFDASAEAERDIQVAFTNSNAEVVYEETIGLTTDTEVYTVSFTMEAEHDNNAMLQFNLGGHNSDVYIDNVFLERLQLDIESENLLENGTFDSLSGWRREAYSPGEATFSEEDGQAKVSIANIGEADWNIQLFQHGVEIEQGASYEVTFDARSTVDRPLRVQIQRNGEEDDIWTEYFDETAALTDQLQTFTYSFEMTEPSDPAAKFGFALGKDAEGLTPEEEHDVFIDNVAVRKVEVGDPDIGDPDTEDSDSEDPGNENPGNEDPDIDDPDAPTERPMGAAFFEEFHFHDEERWSMAGVWTNGDMFNTTWYPEQVTFDNDKMQLTLDHDENASETGIPYKSGELRTNDFYHYGFYEVSMRPVASEGTVSSFFTYTGEWDWDNDPWDEIDIEFLGKDTTRIQFNYFTDGVGGNEYYHDLDFDASQSFNTYGFDWREDSITWYVNGEAVYTATENIPQTPQKIMMNLWPGIGVDDWTGTFDDDDIPLVAEYDWVRYTPVSELDDPEIVIPETDPDEDQDPITDPDQSEDQDHLEDEDREEDDRDGEKLPSTATSIYTMLFIGVLTLLIGAVCFAVVSYRKRLEQK
ncbi:beta-glucanase [Amphibacillus cookii]|uniref:beta-glucanase n=1 Tax=Amphibacillus cookii TaxID=767787 RepID=UPI00195EDD87|nr:family 16 glycosylhydrolase [Amphibacillus cookii]MBM7541160.1 beta-glucanase (GH16 family) [Amphibacillus cookii]